MEPVKESRPQTLAELHELLIQLGKEADAKLLEDLERLERVALTCQLRRPRKQRWNPRSVIPPEWTP